MNDWKAKEAAKASAAAALQAAFPYLVPVGGKVDSLQAAAKNIRIELSRAFPGIKFSVKSSRFSMGDSISIRWIDGPNDDQVEAISCKYQGGYFNSLDDIYEYSRGAWKDAFGSGKYVSCNRDNSDKAIDSAIRSVFMKRWVGLEDMAPPSADEYRSGALMRVNPSGNNYDLQSMIYQVMCKRCWAISKAPKVKELEEGAAA